MTRERLLAINFGGIGDEILFLPLIASIKERYPHCHLTLLCEPRSRSVAEVTELIDRVVVFDIKKRPLLAGDLLDLLGLVREEGYDAVVSSGSSPAVAVLLFLSGIPVRVGFDSGAPWRLLLTGAVPLNKNQYAAWMYHDLASGLGIEAAPRLPALAPSLEHLERMQAFLHGAGCTTGGAQAAGSGARGERRPLVVVHPGTSKLALAKGVDKTWPAADWGELIGRLADAGVDVVLAGGPDDAEIVAEIEATLSRRPDDEGKPQGSRGVFAAAYGKTAGLADLAALIALADLLVCVDSAPMHLGVGLGKPLLALFGPTDERLLLPPDERFVALRQPGTGPCPDAFKRSGRPEPIQQPSGTGVGIPPDRLFQAVMDRLWPAAVPDSSPEPCR